MSMISSLIDELNKSADEWNSSNMFELARMCREAADTIWQLRDDLQRANAENAKLREMIGDVGNTLFSLDIDYCGSCTADNVNHPCPVYTVKGGECLYKTAMRELGIEVDDAS